MIDRTLLSGSNSSAVLDQANMSLDSGSFGARSPPSLGGSPSPADVSAVSVDSPEFGLSRGNKDPPRLVSLSQRRSMGRAFRAAAGGTPASFGEGSPSGWSDGSPAGPVPSGGPALRNAAAEAQQILDELTNAMSRAEASHPASSAPALSPLNAVRAASVVQLGGEAADAPATSATSPAAVAAEPAAAAAGVAVAAQGAARAVPLLQQLPPRPQQQPLVTTLLGGMVSSRSRATAPAPGAGAASCGCSSGGGGTLQGSTRLPVAGGTNGAVNGAVVMPGFGSTRMSAGGSITASIPSATGPSGSLAGEASVPAAASATAIAGAKGMVQRVQWKVAALPPGTTGGTPAVFLGHPVRHLAAVSKGAASVPAQQLVQQQPLQPPQPGSPTTVDAFQVSGRAAMSTTV